MTTERRFDELSRSLASGFFADKVVRFLARYPHTKELREQDKALLDKIIVFLQEALKGIDWLEQPVLTRDSVRSAAVFDKAMLAAPGVETENELKFKQYLNDLITIADGVKREQANENDINKLRIFFREIGRTELMRTERVYLNIERTRGDLVTVTPK